MAIPAIPIVLAALPTMVEMAHCQTGHEAKIREIEANERVEAMRAELRRLEIESDNQKVQAQKEILQSLIDAATHAFDKKIDAFTESFRRSHSLVEEHQKALLEEQRELKDKLFEDLNDNQFLALNNRISEISGTLIDLKKVSTLMVQEFNQKIEDTYLDMDSSKYRLTST